ncbi:hypothetical protein TRM7557_01542 [Tritonibacter multivorans]|uniref:Lysozyme inhibitor LprI-like N-terminal domain-containing protein n=1 Tax=Tritonibacter multivorans TaxID=928856 RepID=A0A0P1G846_9RHOB|nr:lysozyme inhibitor LprI family protein [Tritonibacter multivorans]MDA7422309.1 lysozyme inhibitor LprI family protein [Tritonibacter multivorans]CUH77742.1 hypothetical protein TRM7557_01542 [Tritonibacter multivorans]SFD12861.1 Uncharacterized conserved protein YecT, DUF1311 family [Tritonibacter multivorans]
MRLVALALALLATGPAPSALQAQDLDCSNPLTQVEMTGCAAQAFEAADADLNLAYRMARDMARSLDQGLPADQIPAEIILRDAQRAWIPYRDQACEAESLLARGGSLQNQLFYMCLERLTRARTEDLRLFGEVN